MTTHMGDPFWQDNLKNIDDVRRLLAIISNICKFKSSESVDVFPRSMKWAKVADLISEVEQYIQSMPSGERVF